MKTNERKKMLRSANRHLKDALDLIGFVSEDLRMALCFVPDNLKSGAQFEKREANVDRLFVIMDEITYASDELSDIIG